jgi:hypothetical protein
MGTYSLVGASTCSTCTDGHICKSGSITAAPTESTCPAGFYCYHNSNGLQVTPCGEGTYNSQRGQSSQSACSDCSAGSYCLTGSSEQLTCTPGAKCGTAATSNF